MHKITKSLKLNHHVRRKTLYVALKDPLKLVAKYQHIQRPNQEHIFKDEAGVGVFITFSGKYLFLQFY